MGICDLGPFDTPVIHTFSLAGSVSGQLCVTCSGVEVQKDDQTGVYHTDHCNYYSGVIAKCSALDVRVGITCGKLTFGYSIKFVLINISINS